MNTAIIRSNSKSDIDLLLKLARKIGVDVKLLTEEQQEDYAIVKAIKVGRTGLFVNTAKYLEQLKNDSKN